MRFGWILIALALALVACAHVSPKIDTSPPARSLEEALAQLQRKADAIVASHKAPSVAMGIVQGARLIWFRGFGHRDVEGQMPLDENTAFRIGSITKTLTSVALLQLRDAGKLSLDDPLTKYVPEAAGVVNPGTEPIRLRNLVTHTSGLGREVMPKEGPTQEALLAALKGLPLEFEPGTSWSYSNYAMALAGLVVERASGEQYRLYMQRHVFDPLGMSSTAFDPAGLPPGSLAVGYEREGDGPYHPIAKQRDGGAMEPCGGVYSTVADLAKYAAFELGAWWNRGSEVLSARSRIESQTPTAMPLSAGPIVGVNWFVSGSKIGRSIWHDGSIDGYRALLAFYPNRDMAVIVLIGGDEGGMAQELEFAAVDALQSWVPALDARPGPEMRVALKRLIDLIDRPDPSSEPSPDELAAIFSEGFLSHSSKKESLGHFVGRVRSWLGQCPETGVALAGMSSFATVWYACEKARAHMDVWLEPGTGLISGWMAIP